MKTLTLTFLFILFTFQQGNAQTKMPKNINDDFAYYLIENYKYGNGNTKLFVIEALRRKGYEPMDIDVLVESIGNNSKNRDIILKAFHDNLSTNKEYLYMNLASLGIPAASSKYLAEYIIGEQYKPLNSISEKSKEQKKDFSVNSIKKESNVSVEDNADGIGNNFEARKIIYKSSPKYICSEQGKVVVSILVDREGNCIEANAGVKGTTNYAICLLDEAKVAAMNTRWNADSSAPDKQVGQIIYNFNLN